MKKSEILIYLATPYSHPDKTKVRKRYMEACELAGDLFRQGYMAFSPISHTHGIAEMSDLPGEFTFWEQYDRIMIAKCDILLIAQMEGYSMSVGITAEKRIAGELGKPVVEATPTEIKDNKWFHPDRFDDKRWVEGKIKLDYKRCLGEKGS